MLVFQSQFFKCWRLLDTWCLMQNYFSFAVLYCNYELHIYLRFRLQHQSTHLMIPVWSIFFHFCHRKLSVTAIPHLLLCTGMNIARHSSPHFKYPHSFKPVLGGTFTQHFQIKMENICVLAVHLLDNSVLGAWIVIISV